MQKDGTHNHSMLGIPEENASQVAGNGGGVLNLESVKSEKRHGGGSSRRASRLSRRGSTVGDRENRDRDGDDSNRADGKDGKPGGGRSFFKPNNITNLERRHSYRNLDHSEGNGNNGPNTNSNAKGSSSSSHRDGNNNSNPRKFMRSGSVVVRSDRLGGNGTREEQRDNRDRDNRDRDNRDHGNNKRSSKQRRRSKDDRGPKSSDENSDNYHSDNRSDDSFDGK
jgi:hypothetical protein